MLIIDDEHKTTMMYKKELMSANTPEELRKERLRLIGIDFANCFNDLFFYFGVSEVADTILKAVQTAKTMHDEEVGENKDGNVD